MMTELFQQALHIDSPWLIKTIDFDVDKKRLDIHIDFSEAVLLETLIQAIA